jgi:predicted ATPase
MIRTLAFAGYRSLRDVRLALAPLTVITGPNGAGKSNVYRALRLLVDAANGTLGRAIASEGGMTSVLWAGPGRQKTSGGGTRLSIGFADDAMAYELRLGFRLPGEAFPLDPIVKEETRRPARRCARCREGRRARRARQGRQRDDRREPQDRRCAAVAVDGLTARGKSVCCATTSSTHARAIAAMDRLARRLTF